MKSQFGPEFHMAAELAIATCQYPAAQAAYRSGLTCQFARLNISSTGIYDTAQDAVLGWGDLVSIKINNTGLVCIRRHGQ